MTAPALNPGKPWHTRENCPARYPFEDRVGIMLHYDASASDTGALDWLRSAECKLGYHWLIMDNGGQETIAPPDVRVWHAGPCRSSLPSLLKYKDANWAFYGIAIAATDGERATAPQKQAVANLCTVLMQRHEWSRRTELWRIVGHEMECWPRRRKHDPHGTKAIPVMSVTEIREMVMERL